METVIANPANKEQLKALKAVMKALKVDFKVEKSPYDPEFVAKIQKADRKLRKGRVFG